MNKNTFILLAIVALIVINIPTLIIHINSKEVVTKKEKEIILLEGKEYFKKNEKNEISIKELIDRGYINKETIENYNCNLSSSTIKKVITLDNEFKYYLKLYCENKKSELTLFE